jgi:hypothetical protein
VAVGLDEDGIRKPGLISGAHHLETKLFLGYLPELLRVHARSRATAFHDRLDALSLITHDSDTDCSIHSFLSPWPAEHSALIHNLRTSVDKCLAAGGRGAW